MSAPANAAAACPCPNCKGHEKPVLVSVPAGPLKLDLGCGPHPREGFVGVDSRQFPGVQHLIDLGRERWPWDDGSVEEAHCSHMLEHLTQEQRCHFLNELHRVLKKDGRCTIITPHWASHRAYGDPTHAWPPVAESFYWYVSKKFRDEQAPHTNDMLCCDFDATYGYSLATWMQGRSLEFQQGALAMYKEAAQDMAATLVKR